MAKEDFYLTDEQRMIRDLARKVAREKVAPHAAAVDETETYPEASIQALIDAGLYGIWVPEEYGGTAMAWPAATSSRRTRCPSPRQAPMRPGSGRRPRGRVITTCSTAPSNGVPTATTPA